MRLATPDDQPHLRPEADVGMMVLVAVRRRLDVDAPRHGGVVVQEHALPGNLHAVADQHAVGLVEAVGQRIVGLVRARAAHRAGATTARAPGALSGSAAVIASLLNLSAIGVRLPIRISSAIDRAGGEHLHAGHGDAGGVLGHDLEIGIVALLAGEQLGRAHAGRRRDRKAEIEVVPARALVEAQRDSRRSPRAGSRAPTDSSRAR